MAFLCSLPSSKRRCNFFQFCVGGLCRALFGLLILALSACTVGPDMVRPDPRAPAVFANTQSSSEPNTALTAAPLDAQTSKIQTRDPEFWQEFNDPLLTALIEDPLGSNYDLKTALARFDLRMEWVARCRLRERSCAV